MERQPYTFPFTEEEMREIEAKAADRKAQQATQESSDLIGWVSVPVWVLVLLVVFSEPLGQYDAWVAVAYVIFPSILLGGLTGRLLSKPKTP